jgi:hypothetical protein
MKSILFSALSLFSSLCLADDIFVIKKTMNPKNELHYEALVKDCKLIKPTIKPYWVMGEEDGHHEDITKMEQPFFHPRITYISDTETDFSFGAMDKMGSRLPDKNIRVRLEDCKPKAYIEIKGQELQLLEINVKMGLLMSVKSMSVIGVAPNGTRVTHSYSNDR